MADLLLALALVAAGVAIGIVSSAALARRPSERQTALAQLELLDQKGRDDLLATLCIHCGAIAHDSRCPRVKTVEYGPTGTLIKAEYWPRSEWITGAELWPSDLYAQAAQMAMAEANKRDAPAVKVITG